MHLFMILLLPGVFIIAATAAAIARWLDRRADRIYAEHRAMILELRARLAEHERNAAREAALAYWRSVGAAVNGIVKAFTEMVRPIADSVQAIAEGMSAVPKSGAQPADPRMAKHGQFARRR